MGPSEYAVSRCPPPLRAEALRSLHADLPMDLQTALVQAIDAVRNEGEVAWDGLFVHRCGERLNTIWAQPLPGRTAALWPPAVRDPAARSLLQAANRFLDQQAIAITQVLLELPRDEVGGSLQATIHLLASCDYHWLANLQYLVAEKTLFPSTPPILPLQFEARAGDQPLRLAALIEQTYVETWDCPSVEGIRSITDVLTSYQATGNYQRQHWFFVQHQERDVGALLLAPHGSGEVWEVVYMGIVPDARGHGFGCQLVQHAFWRTAHGGGNRLVLAVDESNSPALSMYHRMGLTGWDRRQVHVRLAEGKPLESGPL